VGTHVLFEGRLLIPSLSATFKGTHKGLLSCVDASVNQQMGGSQKSFSTQSAHMWLSALVVTATVIQKIAFG
jgi:hypothetical protein